MDLKIHGDPSKFSGPETVWGDNDIKLWSNPKAVAKIEKTLANLGIRGRANIVFDDRALDWIGQKPRRAYDTTTFDKVDGINLVIANNSAGPFAYPLTAWMIIHRLCHAFQLSGLEWHQTNSIVYKLLCELARIAGIASGHWVFPKALTMGSSRTHQLHGDALTEMLTQLIFTGNVGFKRAEEWDWRREEETPSNFIRDMSYSRYGITCGSYERGHQLHVFCQITNGIGTSTERQFDACIAEYQDQIIDSLHEDLQKIVEYDGIFVM